jgi:hypothetical protein
LEKIKRTDLRKQKTISKIKECQKYFLMNTINMTKGSKKLSQEINRHKSAKFTSQYKIDKYKHLIVNNGETYSYDPETGVVFDLTPLYQKRRIKKANLSRINKQNVNIAKCEVISDCETKNFLISDYTDVSEIYFGFPLRLCPMHSKFQNESKILSMVVSSKHTMEETEIALEAAIFKIRVEARPGIFFHTD